MRGPVTLGDLVSNEKLLWVYCCDCGHERDVNPATVLLPAETPVPDLGKHINARSAALGSSTPSPSFTLAALMPSEAVGSSDYSVIARRCANVAPLLLPQKNLG